MPQNTIYSTLRIIFSTSVRDIKLLESTFFWHNVLIRDLWRIFAVFSKFSWNFATYQLFNFILFLGCRPSMHFLLHNYPMIFLRKLEIILAGFNVILNSNSTIDIEIRINNRYIFQDIFFSIILWTNLFLEFLFDEDRIIIIVQSIMKSDQSITFLLQILTFLKQILHLMAYLLLN